MTESALAKDPKPGPASTPASSRPAKQKGSLRYKFGASITLLLVLTIIFVSVFALRGEEKALREEMKQRGITIARNLAANAAKALFVKDILSLSSLVKDAMENKNVTYAIIVDENNIIAAHNDITFAEKPYQRPREVPDLGDKTLAVSEPFTFKNGKIVDVSIPILLNNQLRIGSIHVGLSQTFIEQTISEAVQQILFLALVFILIGIVVTVIIVAVIVRPIRALEAGAEIIGQGNLDYTIQVKSRDEIGNLAQAFNRMTTDLKQAQVKIIEKEKMEQELETARKIQSVLLPKENPIIEGFQIVSFYKSAREVGGDYFDFLWVTKKTMAIAIADVSGKGVPGSLGMVMTRSILRTQATLPEAGEVLRRTNALLFKDIKRGMFVTMFYAILDTAKKTINCANAGHNPLILAHADGRVELLNPSGIALGLDSGERFDAKLQTATIQLKPGDAFIVYTDGVTEAMNPKEEEFTEERLAHALGRNVQLSGQALSDTLINELMEFAAGAPQHDDITLLTVKVL
jgi:serine phosphatase RsbU (regulator of sigma subunit)